MINLTELKEKALAASQGTWVYKTFVIPDDPGYEQMVKDFTVCIPGERSYHLSVITEGKADRPIGALNGDNAVWLVENEGQNAEYVVAAQPSVVLELIDRIEKLEKKIDRNKIITDSLLDSLEYSHNRLSLAEKVCTAMGNFYDEGYIFPFDLEEAYKKWGTI